MKKALQFISFDVPDPPNYGGAVDVFYKIRALSEAGVEIHLHCFQYGRPVSARLEELCASVHYYHRNRNPANLFGKRPFITLSRRSVTLIRNLANTTDPIWIEGLHGCSLLESDVLSERTKYVRTHNVEHDYYRSLSNVTHSVFQRWYLSREANKLERYESILANAKTLFAISEKDKAYFKSKFQNVDYLPVFQAQRTVDIPDGTGAYILYHGNLGVGENNQAAQFLVRDVFPGLELPLVIAGSNPSQQLKKLVSDNPNIRLVNPKSSEEMDNWIRGAQIHLLPTFQATGLKIKLLHAIFMGRHVVVNKAMLTDPILTNTCEVFDSAAEARDLLRSLFENPVSPEVRSERQKILTTHYNTQTNVENLIRKIFV